METEESTTSSRLAALGTVCAAWLVSTWLFWVGYAGADDAFYARYAWFFHRPPIIWWEFRMLPILAMRASFILFGPTEFAAVLPNLILSLVLLATVGWMTGWPRRITWFNQMGMLMLPFIPWDAAFRTYPGPTYFSAALFCIGAGLALGPLDGTPFPRLRYLGAVLIGLAFSSHELNIFPLVLFCLVALYFDWRKYIRPVILCAGVVAMSLGIEGIVYSKLLGDPLARFHSAANGIGQVKPGVDINAHISGWQFYTWPFTLLVFEKAFACSLIFLLLFGLLVWKRLGQPERILFLTTFAIWVWFGFGTAKPWAYTFIPRQSVYYGPLILGIAILLPLTVSLLFERRPQVAKMIMIGFLGIFILSSAAGGRWGQNVVVARELLNYAGRHPDWTFVTDVNTMNEMFQVGGYSLPRNVVCLNGPAVEKHLLLNKEPAASPRFSFPVVKVRGILINTEEQSIIPIEPEMESFRTRHPGRSETVAEPRTKWIFRPFARLLGGWPFTVLNLGGRAVLLPEAVSTGSP